jgi:hypothetical protein
MKLKNNCRHSYQKTCGNRDCITKKTTNKKLEKYGTLNGIDTEKLKTSLIKKYGVDNISKIESIKKKKIETCLKHFGVKHPMQSSVIMEKSKNTLMKLYGVDNISKVPAILEILRNHWFEIDPIYGISKIQLKCLKEKERCLKKYGTEYYFQTDEFKEKYKITCKKLWSVDNYSKSEDFKQFLLDNGLKNHDITKTKIELYIKECRKYTGYSYTKYKKELERIYHRCNSYHLDHIFSISDGFKQNINPKIIGSIVNLQIIPNTINLKKNAKSWIEIDKLLLLFNNLSIEDKFEELN